MSEAEYLAFEVTAEIRHAFDQGTVTAMAGGSPAHSQIGSTLAVAMGTDLDPLG